MTRSQHGDLAKRYLLEDLAEQYTFDRENEYFAAQDDARRDRRGLWAMDNPEPPWSFKRRQRRRSKALEGQGQLI